MSTLSLLLQKDVSVIRKSCNPIKYQKKEKTYFFGWLDVWSMSRNLSEHLTN